MHPCGSGQDFFMSGSFAFVNGVAVELDISAYIENSRTYPPLRFVSEVIGSDVIWIDSTKQIIIIP